MPKSLFEKPDWTAPENAITELRPAKLLSTYNMNGCPLKSSILVQIDVKLEIRHGGTLALRKVPWLVCNGTD